MSLDVSLIMILMCLSQGTMLQLLEALASIHQHGVVHRDIKVNNIMVDRATGRAKITDFGLAVQLSKSRMERLWMVS